MINPQPSPSEITVFAPAKINVILRILGRRPDGFHNLWSIMQTVALEDEVQIRLRADRQDIRLRCDATQLAADQNNLVYRAATEVLARAQQSIGLDIELRKRIPMGAGLGGGSSDAAATIIGLNHLLRLEWSPTQMADAGQLLGSDVPFFSLPPQRLWRVGEKQFGRSSLKGRDGSCSSTRGLGSIPSGRIKNWLPPGQL